MDSQDRDRPAPPSAGSRAALTGLLMGVAISLVISGANALSQGKSLDQAWPEVLLTALVAGGVLALGGLLAGRYLGAVGGAFLALVPVIFVISHYFPELHAAGSTAPPLPAGTFALSGPTLAGGSLDVKDHRGKVVLVDFWATWCIPCRAELPHVKEAYEKYHDQGFEVIGVSLDDSRDDLAEYVRDNKLTWPQIFFAEEHQRGWRNPLATRHQVMGIPATFLLDREGQVIARDLRGPEVVSRVAAALEGSPVSLPSRQLMLVLALGSAALVGGLAGALVHRRLLTENAG